MGLRPVLDDAAAYHVIVGISARDVAGPRTNRSLDMGSMGPYKAASTIGGFDPINHFTQGLGLADAGSTSDAR